MCGVREVQFFVRENGQRGGEDAGVAAPEAIGRVGVVVGEGRRRRGSPRAAVTWWRLLPLLDGERHSKTWWAERCRRSVHHCIRGGSPSGWRLRRRGGQGTLAGGLNRRRRRPENSLLRWWPWSPARACCAALRCVGSRDEGRGVRGKRERRNLFFLSDRKSVV